MNQLPAHIAARQSRNLAGAAVAGLGAGSHPRISIRANRWSLVDAAGNAQMLQQWHLDVICVDINEHVSKVFYDTAWDPNASEATPPACWSDNGIGPSVQASKPQHPTCAACPNNSWGSAISNTSQKGIKACSDVKKWAVIIPGMGATLYELRIPPASLKHSRAYAGMVDQNGAGLDAVITRLTFDPQTQGVINFEAAGWASEEDLKVVDWLVDQKSADPIIGRLDQPRDPNKPLPLAAPQGGAAQLPPPGMPPHPPAPPQQFAPQPVAPLQQTFITAPPQQFAPPPQAAPPQMAPPPMPPQAVPQAPPMFAQQPPQAPPFMQTQQPPQAPAEPAPAKRGRGPAKPKPAAAPPPQQTYAPPQEVLPPQTYAPPQEQQAPPPFMQAAPPTAPAFTAAPPPIAQVSQPSTPPAPSAAPSPSEMPPIPAFLQRSAPPPAPPAQHGMQTNPPAPDPQLTQALQQAFAPPPPPPAG